ncbi:hypothetical protein L9F63_026038, partial [Diploptera punctata]
HCEMQVAVLINCKIRQEIRNQYHTVSMLRNPKSISHCFNVKESTNQLINSAALTIVLQDLLQIQFMIIFTGVNLTFFSTTFFRPSGDTPAIFRLSRCLYSMNVVSSIGSIISFVLDW